MKKTQLLDAVRNIKKQFVSFLSIVVIAMLAATAYLAIAYTSAALRKTASDYFNTWGFWDIEVSSTLLMDEEDLEAIRAVPGVASAEPVWQIDSRLICEGGSFDASIISLPQEISRPELLEGRLPETTDECAVEEELLKKAELSVGDEITIENAALMGIDALSQESFVITGTFRSPDHISFLVSATPYILMTKEAFNLEGMDTAFMKTRVRVADAPDNRYSDEYLETVRPVKEAIEALAEERAPLRTDTLQSAIDKQREEGQQKLDDASAELEEKRAELEDAKQKLEDARAQLDDGWRKIRESEKQLEDAKEQLDDGGEALTEAEYQLEAIPDWFSRAIYILDAANIDVSGAPLVGGLVSRYEDSIEQYGAGRMTWYSKGEEYLDAVTLYDRGMKQLQEGEAAYSENLAKVEDGEKQLQEGEEKLRDAKKQLEDAETMEGKLDDCRWVVLNDLGNAGYVYADTNAGNLSSLSLSFSLIFLVVAALVIYATISSIVEEQRKLIGATKALCLYNREIFAKYLLFGVGGAVIGILLGILCSYFLLQKGVLRAYGMFFTYGAGDLVFLPLDTALVAAGGLAISLLSVYLACSQLLRLPAVKLIQGDTGFTGGKKSGKSSSRSLYSRLIIRNMVTDWKRVLVTIVSVAGSCILLVIGFTLKYAVDGVPVIQFEIIQQYEATLSYDTGKAADAEEALREVLDENGLSYVALHDASAIFKADDTLNTAELMVAEKGELDGFFALRDAKTGEAVDLPDSGMLVTKRFSEYYGVNPGDSFMIYDSKMNLDTATAAGVFNNYFGQFMFMTPEGYEELYDTEPERNCFLVKTGELSLDELREKVAEVDGFEKLADAAAERARFTRITGALNYVELLMLVLAGVMAYFILMNLSATYIQKKTKELTIMRINGFTVGECVYYAALDLVITTILGTLLGLVSGGVLAYCIVRMVEMSYMQLVRTPVAKTYLYAALITCGFSLIVNAYTLRVIKDLKLSDI